MKLINKLIHILLLCFFLPAFSYAQQFSAGDCAVCKSHDTRLDTCCQADMTPHHPVKENKTDEDGCSHGMVCQAREELPVTTVLVKSQVSLLQQDELFTFVPPGALKEIKLGGVKVTPGYEATPCYILNCSFLI